MVDGTTAQILTTVGMGLVYAGALWKGAQHVSERLERMVQRLDEQNGRIDRLEQWRKRREGYEAGYERAREKYDQTPKADRG